MGVKLLEFDLGFIKILVVFGLVVFELIGAVFG